MSALKPGMTVRSPADAHVMVREMKKSGSSAVLGIPPGTTFLVVAVLGAVPAEKIAEGDLMAVVPGRLAFYLLEKDVAEGWRPKVEVDDWPKTMTKTRKEMQDLGLPGDADPELVVELSDEIVDKRRWVTVYELVFRLVGMPENLAYRTYYEVGSTEHQDQRPWEFEPAQCHLVHSVEKIVKVWEEVE